MARLEPAQRVVENTINVCTPQIGRAVLSAVAELLVV